MKHKANYLLAIPPLTILLVLLNEFCIHSQLFLNISLIFMMQAPVLAALYLSRRFGGDKQTYVAYTAVIVIVNILLSWGLQLFLIYR